MRLSWWGTAAIGAAFLFTSCSSSGSSSSGLTSSPDGGAGSCAFPSACGGDIVGTWRVTQSCVTGTQDLSNVCPGATAEIEFTISGTATFNADGSYSSMPMAGPVTYHEHFPSGCMPFGRSCDQLGQALDGGASVSGTCSTDSAGTCNCTATVSGMVTNQMGAYAASGSTLTLAHDGTTNTTNYCVHGDNLYEMVGPGDGGITSMGGIVLTRQ